MIFVGPMFRWKFSQDAQIVLVALPQGAIDSESLLVEAFASTTPSLASETRLEGCIVPGTVSDL